MSVYLLQSSKYESVEEAVMSQRTPTIPPQKVKIMKKLYLVKLVTIVVNQTPPKIRSFRVETATSRKYRRNVIWRERVGYVGWESLLIVRRT